MGLVPFDPFVIALKNLHGSVIERICRIVYRQADHSLIIGLWSGDELRLFPIEEATFQSRAQVEGIEFVERVARQLLRHTGWSDAEIERADISDDKNIPPVVRCTTTWFPK